MDNPQMIKVTIDGRTIEVPNGTTILEAARMIGEEVAPPAMCFYKPLKESGGKCRTCLVKVTQGSEKDPRPMPKLVPSCKTNVMDGMVVENNDSEQVRDTRAGITELLLINHPLDCPVCDQAGECKLQDLSFEFGKGSSRYEMKRMEFEEENIGDYIKLNKERCILCYRCVYVANEISDTREQGVLYRGDKAEISTYINKALDSKMIGNVIDVCPVGALTDNTYRFKSRVWFTDQFDAHRKCTHCSGKVVLNKVGGKIVRVTARKNKWNEVEDWICNECRFEKKEDKDWTIEGPRKIDPHSVQSVNHYVNEKEIKSIK